MRTQIALDAEQHARAKQKAAALGLTMAEYIRRLVDRDLAGASPQASPDAIIGLGASGGSDIESEGKAPLGEIVADSVERRRA